MTRCEEWRYDFEGQLLLEKIVKASTRYGLSEAERSSLATIAEYLEQGKYTSAETLETHLNYVSSLLSRLTSARRDEARLFQGSLTLESQISRLFVLSRRLVALRSC